MIHRVIILQSAERDIRGIVDWWSEHRSREQAENWYRKIYPAMRGLAQQPERCQISPESDLLATGIRELHFGLGHHPTHRVLFTIVGDEVRVMRVRHAAQQDLTFDDLG